MKSALSQLESTITDNAMAAQILASLFETEDLDSVNRGTPGVLVIHEAEADMIRFMIYDLCKRTKELKEEFYELHERDRAAVEPQRKAA